MTPVRHPVGPCLGASLCMESMMDGKHHFGGSGYWIKANCIGLKQNTVINIPLK